MVFVPWELFAIPEGPARAESFGYDNGTFGYGDSEYLYNMIRHFRPRRIVEIGSGKLEPNGAHYRRASTHVIRPQVDVLHELCVPGLAKPGVVAHVHDIFTLRDYLRGGRRRSSIADPT